MFTVVGTPRHLASSTMEKYQERLEATDIKLKYTVISRITFTRMKLKQFGLISYEH